MAPAVIYWPDDDPGKPTQAETTVLHRLEVNPKVITPPPSEQFVSNGLPIYHKEMEPPAVVQPIDTDEAANRFYNRYDKATLFKPY